MTFRVTPHRQLQLSQQHARRSVNNATSIQNQISSGLRITRPSDDPRGQRTVLNQQTLIDRLETQIGLIGTTRHVLNQANVEILDANTLFVQAKSLALEARQTEEPTDLEAIASEIDGYLNTLERIANAQIDGRYLFGGAQTDRAPYSGIVDGPTVYHGSETNGHSILPNRERLETYLTGQEVFTSPDNHDLFASLRNFRNALRNADQLTSEELGTIIDESVAAFESASNHLLGTTGELSVSLQQLDRLQSRSEDLQLEAQRLLGEAQSTDFASAILQLQEEQNLLQYTFATVTRIFEVSVLDYL